MKALLVGWYSLIAMIFVIVVASLALAGTGTAPAVNKVNINATVPKVAKAACTTIVAGRATSVPIDVTATTMMNWKAFSAADGTAVTVKRSFNSNTAYMPATGETNLPLETLATSAVFTRYSGNSTITLCSDRN